MGFINVCIILALQYEQNGCLSPIFLLKSRTLSVLQSKNLGVVIWAWSYIANVTTFSKSTTDLPKLIIKYETVSTVDIGKSSKYLGRHFNYTMDNQVHMSEALQLLSDLMKKIDDLSCHLKNKLIIYHRYVLSKLSWHLTIVDFSKTWVIQNLDNVVVARYARHLVRPVRVKIHVDRAKFETSMKISHLMEFEA